MRSSGHRVGGSAVQQRTPGQRVIVEPDLPCWTCKMCTSGRGRTCRNLQFFGLRVSAGRHGGLLTLAANACTRCQRRLTITRGADRASVDAGARRAPGGGGGRPVRGRARRRNHRVVHPRGAARAFRWPGVVTDPLAAKRRGAAALGADDTVDASTPDVAGQVRKLLAGAPTSSSTAWPSSPRSTRRSPSRTRAERSWWSAVRPGGDHPLPLVQDHQIRIQGSATYLRRLPGSADLLGRGAVKTATSVTATRPLDQVAEAFELRRRDATSRFCHGR